MHNGRLWPMLVALMGYCGLLGLRTLTPSPAGAHDSVGQREGRSVRKPDRSRHVRTYHPPAPAINNCANATICALAA